MLATVSCGILVYAISCAAWWIIRRFLIPSSLDKLPGPPQYSWLLGNIPQLFDLDGWGFHFDILERYGRVMKIRGALGERIFMTFDPKALYHILVKDQDIYEQSTGAISRNGIYMGEGLLATLGKQHRKQRKMMNPVFSISHMRDMIPTFYEVTERLRTTLKKKVENGPQEIDILYWMTRTALELIGQSGMGYSFDSLEDDFDYHPYSKSVKKFSVLAFGPAAYFVDRFILPVAAKFDHPRFKQWLMDHIPIARVQTLRKAVDMMYQTSCEIIDTKKKGLQGTDPQVVAEPSNRKDFISILMRANAAASEGDRLSDSEVIGQISTIVFAAMDTSSSAISRVLLLLATHTDVQSKLRDEVREAQQNGQLTYDQMMSLPYLDAVCRETLRVYPPICLAFSRTARKDAILPLSKPIVDSDGNKTEEIFIKNGTNILISVLGANCDPEIWGPDSYEWKPERWLSPLPETVEQAHMPGVYSHLMTFLGGGRSCIGFKFAQLEMKVVLSLLLDTFKFSLSDKEISWTHIGVGQPRVKGQDPTAHPRLPLKMALAD